MQTFGRPGAVLEELFHNTGDNLISISITDTSSMLVLKMLSIMHFQTVSTHLEID